MRSRIVGGRAAGIVATPAKKSNIAMGRYKFGAENRKPCQRGWGEWCRRYAVSTLVKRFLTAPDLEPLGRIIVRESRCRNTDFAFQFVSLVRDVSCIDSFFFFFFFFFFFLLLLLLLLFIKDVKVSTFSAVPFKFTSL